jgi:catechol 2,3-dioxygenase-like lactoylglutathione lyase family enzyme
MDIKIHYAFLPHTDPEASLAFWRDTLGFEVRQDVGYEGMRWLTVGPPSQPETALVLTPPAVDPGLTDEERQTVLELIAKGSYAALTLATDDVLQEPTDQPYGVRDCAFRDPSGNLLRINETR